MNTHSISAFAVALGALVAFAPGGLVVGEQMIERSAGGDAAPAVIAAGLNNPRGLAFTPNGDLYVAEAGSGGPGPCADGPEGLRCYGPTGSVARIDMRWGGLSRIASGLPSAATEDGSFATGPHGLSFDGRGNGYVTIGYGGNPVNRTADFGSAGAWFASLLRVNGAGNWTLQEDLGGFEEATNPTGDETDSNPYGILALPSRRVVADAGANALNQIAANGTLSTLAIFPDGEADAPDFLELPPGTRIPMDTVPTSVTVGPDGQFYVGQLTGFPFPVGGAKIFRVAAHGGTPEIVAEGFTAIVGLAFGPDGSLYVVELAKHGLLAAFDGNDWAGAVVRIAPDGTRTELAPGAWTAPGGIAVGRDGAVYVTNKSIFSGAGEVIRITP